jgi:hypothetical protein
MCLTTQTSQLWAACDGFLGDTALRAGCFRLCVLAASSGSSPGDCTTGFDGDLTVLPLRSLPRLAANVDSRSSSGCGRGVDATPLRVDWNARGALLSPRCHQMSQLCALPARSQTRVVDASARADLVCFLRLVLVFVLHALVVATLGTDRGCSIALRVDREKRDTKPVFSKAATKLW